MNRTLVATALMLFAQSAFADEALTPDILNQDIQAAAAAHPPHRPGPGGIVSREHRSQGRDRQAEGGRQGECAALNRRIAALLASVAITGPAFAQNQVNGSSISQLPQATMPLSGTELVPLVQGGTTSQTSVSTLLGAPITAASLRLTSVTAFPYLADPTGAANSTAAFQNALNSGTKALYVPPGTYKVCGVVIPNTIALHIFGAGTGSQIIQTGCGSSAFSWSTTAMAYPEQTISDLYFELDCRGEPHYRHQRGRRPDAAQPLFQKYPRHVRQHLHQRRRGDVRA